MQSNLIYPMGYTCLCRSLRVGFLFLFLVGEQIPFLKKRPECYDTMPGSLDGLGLSLSRLPTCAGVSPNRGRAPVLAVGPSPRQSWHLWESLNALGLGPRARACVSVSDSRQHSQSPHTPQLGFLRSPWPEKFRKSRQHQLT